MRSGHELTYDDIFFTFFIQWASQGVEISFDDGLIKVTCEYSGEEIISYRSSSVKKRNIKNLLVSTSNGASGIWTITDLKYFKSRSRREAPSSTIINSGNYEHHYNYDPDYMYEYNSATTIATATVSDNSTSMINDFVMGFQQYEDEEEEELEGEFFSECTLDIGRHEYAMHVQKRVFIPD